MTGKTYGRPALSQKKPAQLNFHRRDFIKSAAAVGILAGGLTPVSARAETSLRVAGQHPVDHHATDALNTIKQEVEEADVGIDIRIFPASQLGGGEEVFDDVARGGIDIGHTFIYSHADPRLEINSIPYLVTNYREMERVFAPGSTFYDTFFETLQNQGVRLLGVFVEGFIGVATTQRPENHDTLGSKELNIRVWNAEVARNAAIAMGFRTTTMPWGDVVPSIQQGVVDGLIGGTAEAYYTMMRDVVNYYTPYNAFVENTSYYMNQSSWDRLNEQQKEVISAAFAQAARASFATAQRIDEEYQTLLNDTDGIEVLGLTDADRRQIAEHVRAETWPALEDKIGKDVLDKLRAEVG